MSAAKKKVAEIINLARKEGRSELLELESKQVLAAWGLPVKRTELAKDPDEAVRIAREIRYPLVIKIASPDIPRKSEARCVKIGIGSELELRQAFSEIVNNAREYKPDSTILGVTVQEYLPPTREVIVGALQDPSFGATVWFGLVGFLPRAGRGGSQGAPDEPPYGDCKRVAVSGLCQRQARLLLGKRHRAARIPIPQGRPGRHHRRGQRGELRQFQGVGHF